MDKIDLYNKLSEIYDSDTVRIKEVNGILYAIAGNDKESKWYDENGKKVDSTYLEEKIIGSGKTSKELIQSVKDHKELENMSMREYLEEQFDIEELDVFDVLDKLDEGYLK